MSDLTIAIPSNRSLAAARESIESAVIFAEKTGCTVVVSDNSGDPEKRACFEGSSPCLVYLVSPNAGAAENVMRALGEVRTSFVMPMGDDDCIYRLDGVPALDLASLSGDVAAVRPSTMSWSLEDGVRNTDRLELLDPDAGQRIATYNRDVKGINNIYYSIYRTGHFRAVSNLFGRYHPTGGGYCDWAMSFALIACGRVLHDPSVILRYNLGRWAEKAGIEEGSLELYRRAGLPDKARLHDSLLRFLDAFVFLDMSELPISAEARASAQRMNAKLALGTYAFAVREAEQLYTATARDFAARIPLMSDMREAFLAAMPVVEEIRPGLSEAYERFHGAARQIA